MMSKSKVSMMRGLKVLYILPLVCGTLALNARTVIDYENSEINSLQQKPVKVEIKKEGESIVYYVDGKKISHDQLSQKISAQKQGNGFDMIELVVDGDIEMGTVTDLKELLRSLDVSKISSMTVSPKTDKAQNGAPDARSARKSESVPFSLVDVKPSFNGGDANEFSKWVNTNLVYPAAAKAAGIQGRVTLQFVVQATGKVTDVTVLRGASDPSLDAEAVRVVSASPDWAPGESDGKKVPVTFTFPVIFQLAKPADNTQAEGVLSDVTVIAYGGNKSTQVGVRTDEVPVNFSELTKKPMFEGQDASAFSNWINKQMIYPESAKTAGIQGRVAVKFKVNADGKVSDISVIRGVCDALDAEAVRLVSNSPAWTPGEVDGKAVATTYTFSVLFQIR